MTYNTLPLSDYVRLSGKALGERVARGELSPVQLAECALHLAKTAEPAINAYVALIERGTLVPHERRRERPFVSWLKVGNVCRSARGRTSNPSLKRSSWWRGTVKLTSQ